MRRRLVERAGGCDEPSSTGGRRRCSHVRAGVRGGVIGWIPGGTVFSGDGYQPRRLGGEGGCAGVSVQVVVKRQCHFGVLKNTLKGWSSQGAGQALFFCRLTGLRLRLPFLYCMYRALPISGADGSFCYCHIDNYGAAKTVARP